MEDTPILQKRLLELQSQVKSYGDNPASFSFDALSSSKVYIAVPVVILLILIFTRPAVLMDEQKDKTLKLSYKKLLLYWLAISFAIILGIFGYNYKTTKQE